jgi:predicted SnoaL-like aldol condensation-catalyzing enzyme
MGTAAEQRNNTFVLGAFDTLADQSDFLAAQWFWSHDYIRHSAHIPPGRDGLFNLVTASSPDRRYENALTVADGDYVVLHGRLSTAARHAARPEADPR